MIAEFFGLSNTGKSVLKKKLDRGGCPVSKFEKTGNLRKFFLFMAYSVKHPMKTGYLFYKLNTSHLSLKLPFKKRWSIAIMRNSYLMGVLAKAQFFQNKKEIIFTDEFSFQSLFMVLQKKSSEDEIKKIVEKLPKSDFLFLFEGKKEWRYKAYQKKHPIHSGTLMPGSGIDKKYAEEWMEIMEHNFGIIKKIILQDYEEDRKTFGYLKLNYPKIYKRK